MQSPNVQEYGYEGTKWYDTTRIWESRIWENEEMIVKSVKWQNITCRKVVVLRYTGTNCMRVQGLEGTKGRNSENISERTVWKMKNTLRFVTVVERYFCKFTNDVTV